MSFWDNLKKFTRPYSEEEFDDYEDDMDEYESSEINQETRESGSRSRRTSPFSGVSASETDSFGADKAAAGTYTSSRTADSSANGFNGQVISMGDRKQDVVLFHAKNFDDAARAADELRRRRAVILNMENIDKSLTRRVVDFLSGSVYALDGSVRKVAQATYLFCPHNMNVMGDLENVQRDMAESYI